jgi:hypothetical protein
LLAVASLWRQTSQAGAIDFYQFWVVGRALEEHPAVDPYSETGRARLGGLYLREAQQLGEATSPRHRQVAQFRKTLGNYSTPALYAAFGALESGDFERDAVRFELLSFGAFLVGLVLLTHLLSYSWTATWLVTAVLASWFAPLHSDLGVMNVNRLQLGVLALVAWLAARGPWRPMLLAGTLLGAAVVVKPNLAFAALVFTLVLAVDRRWRACVEWAVGGALGAAVLFGAACLSWGSVDPWFAWSTAVRELLADWSSHTIEWGNYAAPLVLEETTGLHAPGTLGIASGLTAGSLVSGRRHAPLTKDDPQTLAARTTIGLGLGVVVGLLGARLTWLHYDLLAVPLLLVLWRPRAEAERPGRRAVRALLATLGFIALALRPLQVLLPDFEPTATQSALLTNAGLALLLLAALIECALGSEYGAGPDLVAEDA